MFLQILEILSCGHAMGHCCSAGTDSVGQRDGVNAGRGASNGGVRTQESDLRISFSA